jgi:hypothetical protein
MTAISLRLRLKTLQQLPPDSRMPLEQMSQSEPEPLLQNLPLHHRKPAYLAQQLELVLRRKGSGFVLRTVHTRVHGEIH